MRMLCGGSQWEEVTRILSHCFALLQPLEVAWIDAFHATCWTDVAPALEAAKMEDAVDAARARAWLWRQCRPLGEATCPPVPPLI